MQPDRKIPDSKHPDGCDVRHFAAGVKLSIPFKEKFQIIVRRYRRVSRSVNNITIIDLKPYIENRK